MNLNYYISDAILIKCIYIGLTLYSIVLAILWLTKKRQIFEIKQTIFEYMLVTYIITLLKLTGIIGIRFYFSDVMDGMYSLSLIPFKAASPIMVFLNFLLFLPYGLLLPCVFANLRTSGKKVLLIGFITSFLIELLQLFGGRATEIDDLLVNSLGTFVGFVIFSYANKIIQKVNSII
ncbi:VanZ family protein [Clostridium sardiniense]|uniref:VanZ family protein n=1 Tax=Clostridium sardiniense TaxID=29369 RepID=UPI00195968D2|nr:VanZ family protein [Clostridium sardiniense]MBM7835596.1 glycopeptide antibiotics resistance protein [Clostridium sardiniense]